MRVCPAALPGLPPARSSSSSRPPRALSPARPPVAAQAQGRQWGSVYELAQQAFALAQAVCGPLHRATAVALELIAKALFHLGDPEVSRRRRTAFAAAAAASPMRTTHPAR